MKIMARKLSRKVISSSFAFKLSPSSTAIGSLRWPSKSWLLELRLPGCCCGVSFITEASFMSRQTSASMRLLHAFTARRRKYIVKNNWKSILFVFFSETQKKFYLTYSKESRHWRSDCDRGLRFGRGQSAAPGGRTSPWTWPSWSRSAAGAVNSRRPLCEGHRRRTGQCRGGVSGEIQCTGWRFGLGSRQRGTLSSSWILKKSLKWTKWAFLVSYKKQHLLSRSDRRRQTWSSCLR